MLFTRSAASASTAPADAKNPRVATPMRVTWTKNMIFDNKEKLALFLRKPAAADRG